MKKASTRTRPRPSRFCAQDFLTLRKAKNRLNALLPERLWLVPVQEAKKIRTYNFPQDRITDHRINLSLHNLPSFMMGNMDEMLDALNVYAKEEQLAE